jgi:hypothetical protein
VGRPSGPVLTGNGLADSGLADAEPLRRVRRRAPAAEGTHALVPAGALAALGGAAALGVTLTATAADAPTALAAVTAAAAKTSAESFRIIETQTQVVHGFVGRTVSRRTTGVFDPSNGLGEEAVSGFRSTRIRFVGGQMYAQPGRPGQAVVARQAMGGEPDAAAGFR